MLAARGDVVRNDAATPSAASAGISSSVEAGLVLLRVVRVSSGTLAPGYNLAVEDEHAYFANGVLVHNRDALAHGVNLLAGAHPARKVPAALERLLFG